MINSIKFSEWLLWQATLQYAALVPLSLVCLWALWRMRADPRALFILANPVCWLTPLAFAGAFVDRTAQEAKTADWVGWVALTALTAQFAWSIWAVARLKGLRWLASAAVLVNAPIGLLSAAVTGMASSGDWI